jgi:hypothetical protein
MLLLRDDMVLVYDDMMVAYDVTDRCYDALIMMILNVDMFEYDATLRWGILIT